MSALASRAAEDVTPWARALDRDGYCVVRGAVPVSQVSALSAETDARFQRTPFCEGAFYGARTKRFHALLNRTDGAAAFVMHPLILALAEHVLLPFTDALQLNLTQALELHPGAPAQYPHRDDDMFGGAVGGRTFLVNVMWPFTDYGEANGSTLLWPGSHAAVGGAPAGSPWSATLAPGDALMFLGSTLHGAGANRSHGVRRGMIVSYCLGWLKPYENMWLTYPPERARSMPRPLAELVGYRIHRPNLGNYDGNCPSKLLDGAIDDYAPAVDELRPHQVAALDEHRRRQMPETTP